MALATSSASTVVVGRSYAGALQDVEYSRGMESRSLLACRCMTSSSWGQMKWQWLDGKHPRSSLVKVRKTFGGFHNSPSLKERFDDPVCVIRGVDEASREDRENAVKPSKKANLPRKKNALVLRSIIQEIEPLDISLISRDVSPDSTDAMKRTISGMLGLLPSDQFQVVIESSQEPVARLLVSSMMTGYTLWNGEHGLCLKRSLEKFDISEDRNERSMMEEHMMETVPGANIDVEQQMVGDVKASMTIPGESDELSEKADQVALPEELGVVSPEVANYIQQLQTKLTTTSKELDECKHALTTLEMESMAGEERNDLLDYLRSLEPEKVAELSRPTLPEVENVINEVVDGLLANLCIDEAPPAPTFGDGMNAISKTWEENIASEMLGNRPLQVQSNVTATRDYLARLLFWCMLLGHYMRSVEYRLELSRTLSLWGELVIGISGSRLI